MKTGRRFILLTMAALVAGGVLAPAARSAEPYLRAQLKTKLTARLERIDADFQGALGIELIDLTTGERIGRNAEEIFPTASTIKVAILVELYRRAEHDPALLSKRLPFAASARTTGDGLTRLIGPGSQLAVGDLARLMINLSENTATNLLIDELGMESVNTLLDSLGLNSIRLRRPMLDADAQRADHENVASPAQGAALMARIARCELPLSKPSCEAVLKILEIPQAPFPATDPIPKTVVLAFKPGNLEGVLNGWGIVQVPGRPYVFAIMSSYGLDNAAAVRAASAAAFEYFSSLAQANAFGARVAP